MPELLPSNEDYGPTCKGCGGDDMSWVDCEQCGGEGVDGHDCGEDTCCCLDPEEDAECHMCDGTGGWWICHPCAAKTLESLHESGRKTGSGSGGGSR